MTLTSHRLRVGVAAVLDRDPVGAGPPGGGRARGWEDGTGGEREGPALVTQHNIVRFQGVWRAAMLRKVDFGFLGVVDVGAAENRLG